MYTTPKLNKSKLNIRKCTSLIYSNLSILELNSPTQTSRHTIVRQEIHRFSKFLNAIRDDLTNTDITQHVKHDLQTIFAWFIIDFFGRTFDIIAHSRKNFRPQNTDNETVLAEQSDYVWDPEWSHEAFMNIPTDISSQAISTISIHKDYVHKNIHIWLSNVLTSNKTIIQRTKIN